MGELRVWLQLALAMAVVLLVALCVKAASAADFEDVPLDPSNFWTDTGCTWKVQAGSDVNYSRKKDGHNTMFLKYSFEGTTVKEDGCQRDGDGNVVLPMYLQFKVPDGRSLLTEHYHYSFCYVTSYEPCYAAFTTPRDNPSYPPDLYPRDHLNIIRMNGQRWPLGQNWAFGGDMILRLVPK